MTSREFVTVLGMSGTGVGMLAWSSLPIARSSRWCRRVHAVPAPSDDPVGFLRAVDDVMRSGDCDALLPTPEQAWLFAAGSRHLRSVRPPVADIESFDRVQSKIAFAQTLDLLHLPQPEWRIARDEDDLAALDFPVWVKAALSTAGRGVRAARDRNEARAAWRELSSGGDVMIQRGAPGIYAQVQGVFSHGRLVGAGVSELLAGGVGGSAAGRLSVDHPAAVAALARVGAHLNWHGASTSTTSTSVGIRRSSNATPARSSPATRSSQASICLDCSSPLPQMGRCPTSPVSPDPASAPDRRWRSPWAPQIGSTRDGPSPRASPPPSSADRPSTTRRRY